MDKYIVCPACGREYTPGEIYLPKHFLGQHKNIERDSRGRITDIYGGIFQDTSEIYTCDKCGITFSVKADITYKTEQLSKRQINEYKQRL